MSFEPCPEQRCERRQFVQRGIPPRQFWIVGFVERFDAEGNPTRTESFLVDVRTGDVTRA